MPIWCKDKELSKYNKYKAKMYFSENGKSSERARIARSLAGGTTLAHVRSHVPVLVLHAF